MNVLLRQLHALLLPGSSMQQCSFCCHHDGDLLTMVEFAGLGMAFRTGISPSIGAPRSRHAQHKSMHSPLYG